MSPSPHLRLISAQNGAIIGTGCGNGCGLGELIGWPKETYPLRFTCNKTLHMYMWMLANAYRVDLDTCS